MSTSELKPKLGGEVQKKLYSHYFIKPKPTLQYLILSLSLSAKERVKEVTKFKNMGENSNPTDMRFIDSLDIFILSPS